MHKIYILLILTSINLFAEDQSRPLTFYPIDVGFNIFRGPKDRLILQAETCAQINKLGSDFLTWKEKVEGEVGHRSFSCNCQKDIDPEIVKFFYDKEIRQKDIRNYQLIKKYRAKKDVLEKCYLDITEIMPERVKQLTYRQMVLDSTYEADYFFDIDGVNCYNTALYVNGLIQAERYIDSYEIDQFLVNPICQPVVGENPRPGDIIAYYWGKSPQKIGHPIHMATYISDGIIFDKKGGGRDRPFQLSSERYTEEVYSDPGTSTYKKYFRCLSPIELKKYLAHNREIESLWNYVEEIENCYKEYFLKQNGPLSYSIENLRDHVLMAVSKQIDGMLSERRTYNEETREYNVHEGLQEEVTILEIIQNKAEVMIGDQFGRNF